ncbi:ubiquinone biosynthesis protein UbiJ [Methylomagnum ishizawai]|uniref:Ubiquinone biosynthesis accessory factor UbiJ n=1 Tax=Methylomagnum ishizawai TaxID=1760988 RepID=A0A1Y6CZH4_9GAMM|nr:SCP2 sterol-binding domain-containing protein [Methylomagnum ishizawai]SMF96089.1 ubiquinone biosynthesis protein UbiJ [Methylomagnum ishizawai]
MAPHPWLASVLAGTLETAIARYLALDPDSHRLLAPIAGKLVALRILPFGATVYFCPTESGVQILTETSTMPDVTLSGTPLAFAKLGLGGSAEQSLFAQEIAMQGSTDTAHRFQALFRKLDIDWQGLLARHTGAVAAATLFDLFRSGRDWTRDTAASFEANLAEFWQEESRELPAQAEADAFFKAVDRLRSDRDRLEARIKRLESQAAVPETLPTPD